MKKKYLLFIVFVGVVFFVAYQYLYQDHRNIADEKASFTLTVTKIYTDFTQDEAKATGKYIDKTVLVTGKITSIDSASKTITLDQKLLARFDTMLPTNIKIEETITVKGRILGYDNLLEELQMDQSSQLP
jgi:predicted negative regulator of RcsB-dependent stress response